MKRRRLRTLRCSYDVGEVGGGSDDAGILRLGRSALWRPAEGTGKPTEMGRNIGLGGEAAAAG
jgi:hypothetical protein